MRHPPSVRPRPRTWQCPPTMPRTIFFFLMFLSGLADALHHMQITPPHSLYKRQMGSTQLVVRNQCAQTIWPGILTQHGNGPPTNGFELGSGSSRTFSVSENWQGRVWGRTNCTFNEGGQSSTPCGTGDCGRSLSCIGTVSHRAFLTDRC